MHMDKNTLSVAVATSVALGAIIGAGIFVLSGTAIALAGSYSLLAFVIVGIIALFMALQMGEMGSIFPHAKGAAYSYAYEAFGSQLGFITGLLLYTSFATAVSAVALGFGSYLATFLGLGAAYQIPFALALILVLSIVNIIGIKKAAKVDFFIVIIKISILFFFILFAAIFALSISHTAVLSNFSSPPSDFGGIFAASVVIFFAYTGFQSISTFTSRVKGGARGAARAIVYAVIISIILYSLVDVALMMLAPATAYKINADPLSFALGYAHAPGWVSIIVDIGAMLATTSATLAMILTSSRSIYQISVDRLLPKEFRKYNKKSDVAVNGVIITAAISAAMLFSGNIYVIASISNFGLIFSYIITSFAVIHYRRVKAKASFLSPLYPYMEVVTIVGLIALLIGMPRQSLLIGAMIIFILIIAYYFILEVKGKKPARIKLFK
jgi:APA family basic amino acid/polyamine antiporter